MPKKLKAPPSFLTKKLVEKTADFVRDNVDPFLKDVKRHGKSKNVTAIQILPDFFFWLGDRNRNFRHIESAQLNTNHNGTYQVYNYLRKKMEKLEEKPPTPMPAPKAETPKIPTPARLRKGKDEEAVSMTATGNYQGHHEEKEVPYRRHVGSDHEDSDPEAGDEGFEEDEVDEEDVLAGKPKFERLRDMLVHLMS